MWCILKSSNPIACVRHAESDLQIGADRVVRDGKMCCVYMLKSPQTRS